MIHTTPAQAIRKTVLGRAILGMALLGMTLLGLTGPGLAGLGPRRALAQGNGPAEIAAMIEAHGGMEAWRDAPSVSFSDAFYRKDASYPFRSRTIVEQGARRTFLEYPDIAGRIGWDGETCWSLHWNSPSPPRFQMRLNFYLLNLPWVTQDPGVILSEPGRARLWDDPTEYITVLMTFEPGTGDTPRDHYTLYIHPETHRLTAVEYIVTYADLLPANVEETPPNILVYEGWHTVNGLLVPAAYRIYDKEKEFHSRCVITDWSFSVPFDVSKLEVPIGADIDRSNPVERSAGHHHDHDHGSPSGH